jgi:hypothetical protein
MSRNKGSKNLNKTFYSEERLKKKSLLLSDQIDKYIDAALTNHYFNKIVDFDSLHKVKDDLKILSSYGSKS